MTLEQLRERVRGEIIVPGDTGYDDARSVHNGMSDRRPASVIRVANAGDVMSTDHYARENGLDLAIRGGGHSAPGFGTVDDGVVIDFSRMRSVRVDPRAMTARADAGVTWGDFNSATYAWLRHEITTSATPHLRPPHVWDSALSWVRATCLPDPKNVPMAGSTISFDRGFINVHCPELSNMISYRNVDVSSFKEMVRRWCDPDMVYMPANEVKAHRAMPDILESIRELRYYRELMFEHE
jgi:hypothetical protein